MCIGDFISLMYCINEYYAQEKMDSDVFYQYTNKQIHRVIILEIKMLFGLLLY